MKGIRKVFVFLATLCLCLTTLQIPNHLYAQSAGLPVQEFGNLVIFVDFNNTTDNYIKDKRSRINEIYNGRNPTSLCNYVDAISNGQFALENTFAQDNGTIIQPVILPNPASSYTKEEESQLLSDIISHVNVPASKNASLDKNQDGEIDNVTFAFNFSEGTTGALYYPHKANHNNASTLNGLTIDAYNVQNLSMFSGMYSAQEAVVAHEFLHSIGFPDLYRRSGSAEPIGPWDLMATSPVYLQYPLVALRQNVSKKQNGTGWYEDFTELTSNQNNLILQKSGSKDGDQAFLLKTPYSNDEYFVVEYRKQGNGNVKELDAKIPGSGIIVYRVDTRVERGNIEGPPDAYYVFRPGETDDHAGKGDLKKAFLSSESGRTTYGSSDFDSDIAQGAITYGDGTNSGIVIKNVGSASGDQITFDVEFADTSQRGIWDLYNGTISSEQTSAISMAHDGTVPYVAYDEDNYLHIAKAEGTGWVSVAEFPAGHELSTNKATNYKMSHYQNKLYVIYNDYTTYDGKLVIYDIANETWETPINILTGSVQYTDIASGTDGVYISATDGTNGTTNLNVLKFNDTTKQVDLLASNPTSGNFSNLSLKVNGTTPYIGYYNSFASGTIKGNVAKIEGGTFHDLTALPKESNQIELQINGGNVYSVLAYSSTNSSSYDRLQVYQYVNNAWTPLGNEVVSESIRSVALAFMGNQPYLAYCDEVNSITKTVVNTLINEEWNGEGSRVVDNVTTMDFEIYGDSAMLAYVNKNGSTPEVRYKQVLPEKSKNTDLATLLIKDAQGKVLLELDPKEVTQEIEVPYSIEEIVLDATVADPKSHIDPNGLGLKTLPIGTTEINISVTSESGGVGIYTLYMNRAEASKDALLSTLSIEGATLLESFQSNVFAYTGVIPFNQTSVSIDATANHAMASIDGLGTHPVVEGENVIPITVHAEDGTTQIYTFTLQKPKSSASSNNYLSSLSLENYSITPTFQKDVLAYQANVPENVDEITIKGTQEDTLAIITNLGKHGLKMGDNSIEIVVVAENGITKTYTINVRRSSETLPKEKELETLEITGFLLQPTFQTGVYNYTLDIPYDTTSLDINALAVNANANVRIVGNTDLKVGENTITIMVDQADGTTLTYTIVVTRAAQNTSGTEDEDPTTPGSDPDSETDSDSDAQTGAATFDSTILFPYSMLAVSSAMLFYLLKLKRSFVPYKRKIK